MWLTNFKLNQNYVYIVVLFCGFSFFWLVKGGHVTCIMPQSVIKKVVILNKWWWFFSYFLRTLSTQKGQYWAQNSTGHLLTNSKGFSYRKLSTNINLKNLKNLNLKWYNVCASLLTIDLSNVLKDSFNILAPLVANFQVSDSTVP